MKGRTVDDRITAHYRIVFTGYECSHTMLDVNVLFVNFSVIFLVSLLGVPVGLGRRSSLGHPVH